MIASRLWKFLSWQKCIHSFPMLFHCRFSTESENENCNFPCIQNDKNSLINFYGRQTIEIWNSHSRCNEWKSQAVGSFGFGHTQQRVTDNLNVHATVTAWLVYWFNYQMILHEHQLKMIIYSLNWAMRSSLLHGKSCFKPTWGMTTSKRIFHRIENHQRGKIYAEYNLEKVGGIPS